MNTTPDNPTAGSIQLAVSSIFTRRAVCGLRPLVGTHLALQYVSITAGDVWHPMTGDTEGTVFVVCDQYSVTAYHLPPRQGNIILEPGAALVHASLFNYKAADLNRKGRDENKELVITASPDIVTTTVNGIEHQGAPTTVEFPNWRGLFERETPGECTPTRFNPKRLKTLLNYYANLRYDDAPVVNIVSSGTTLTPTRIDAKAAMGNVSSLLMPTPGDPLEHLNFLTATTDENPELEPETK